VIGECVGRSAALEQVAQGALCYGGSSEVAPRRGATSCLLGDKDRTHHNRVNLAIVDNGVIWMGVVGSHSHDIFV
jgi:hypothetical protein